MTEPTIGLWHDRYHRYYAKYADGVEADKLPGVTSAIGMKDKPAVAYWRGTTVARIIAQDVDLYRSLIETGGVEAAVTWAGKLPGYERDKAADTGTLVHSLVEQIGREQEVSVDPELAPYAAAFRRWLAESGAELISLERQVADLSVGYGGTFDILANVDGKLTLLDVKTWKRRPVPGGDMYSETAMQLAAYGNAAFIGAPGDPKRYRMPKVEAYAVLHLRPDQYDSGFGVYPFEVTDREFEAFRALLTVYRWQQERAKLVIGEPLSAVKVAA